MKHTASLTSQSFWFIESKIMVELMLDDYSKDQIRLKVLKKNLFQLDSEETSKKIVNTLYRRLNSFSDDILEYFLRCDFNSARIFVLISILNVDDLFYEFMHDVFKNHIILGDFELKHRDFDIFFDNKSNQSEAVANWTEQTIGRLIRGYRVMLKEAGILKDNNIIIPFIDLRFKDLLIKEGYGSFLNVITGES